MTARVTYAGAGDEGLAFAVTLDGGERLVVELVCGAVMAAGWRCPKPPTVGAAIEAIGEARRYFECHTEELAPELTRIRERRRSARYDTNVIPEEGRFFQEVEGKGTRDARPNSSFHCENHHVRRQNPGPGMTEMSRSASEAAAAEREPGRWTRRQKRADTRREG